MKLPTKKNEHRPDTPDKGTRRLESMPQILYFNSYNRYVHSSDLYLGNSSCAIFSSLSLGFESTSFTPNISSNLRRIYSIAAQRPYGILPKIQGKSAVGEVAMMVEGVIRQTCKELDIEVIDIAVNCDHVHLFYSIYQSIP